MRPNETIDDLLTTPVSRRTVAAGLWAAPVVALTVAAPAFAASPGTGASATVSAGTTAGGKTTRTVTLSNIPSGATITVSSVGIIKLSSPTGVTKVSSGNQTPLVLSTTSSSGSFTFEVDATSNGTITLSGPGITTTTLASY